MFKHLFDFLLCQRGELARTQTLLWLWTVLSWTVIGFVSLTQQCWHQKVLKQTLFRWENWELDELQGDLLARKPESDRRVDGSARWRSVVLPDRERKGFCQNHWGSWLSQRIESSWKRHYRSQDIISEMLKLRISPGIKTPFFTWNRMPFMSVCNLSKWGKKRLALSFGFTSLLSHVFQI